MAGRRHEGHVVDFHYRGSEPLSLFAAAIFFVGRVSPFHADSMLLKAFSAANRDFNLNLAFTQGSRRNF